MTAESDIAADLTPSDNERVRALIDDLNFTQAQAADELGIDPRTISRYCREGYPVPRMVLLALEMLKRL